MIQKPSPYEVSESTRSSVSASDVSPAVSSSTTKVFGIIHIIYGGIGIINVFGVVLAAGLLKVLVDRFGGQAKELEALLAASEELMSYAYLELVSKFVFGILLLVAGIGLIQKKTWALGLSLFWAVARIVVAIIFTIVAAEPTRVFQEKVMESQGGENVEMLKNQEMASAVGNVVGVVMVCIYPIIILIFLSKKGAKQSLNSAG